MNGSDDPLAPRHRKAVSVSVRLYRKLLLVYPRQFREEYAAEMARYFGEMCEDSSGRGGFVALVVTWLRTLYELAVSARMERVRTLPRRDTDPETAVLVALFIRPGAGQAYNGQVGKSALHVLAFLASFIVPLIWFPMGGLYALLLVMCVGVCSALDAWLMARRIKALQHADY